MNDVLTFVGWVDNPHARKIARSECWLVKVPTLFYVDHVQRDLTQGVVTNSGHLLTQLWLDREALDDLIGDADYYAGFTGEDFEWNKSICNSAKTTLRRLREQVPEAFVKEVS